MSDYESVTVTMAKQEALSAQRRASESQENHYYLLVAVQALAPEFPNQAPPAERVAAYAMELRRGMVVR